MSFQQSYLPEATENLKRLVGRITMTTGKFAFYPVACSLPEPLIKILTKECQKNGVVLKRVDLIRHMVEDLRQQAEDFLPQPLPENTAVVITGLEPSILLDSNERQPAVLQVLNLARERYEVSFPCPFILCLMPSMLKKVQEVAPDFWAWRSAEPLKFEAGPKHFLQKFKLALAKNDIVGWDESVARVGLMECLKETYEVLKAKERINPEHLIELNLFAELGNAYKSLRKYAKAQIYYEKALEIARQLENQEKTAQILNNLGIVLRGLEDAERSLEFFQDYQKMAEGQNNVTGQLAALNNIGLIFLDQGRLEEAERALKTALSMGRTLRDQAALSILCNTMGNLGIVARHQDKIDEAIALHYETLSTSRKIKEERSYPYQKDLIYLGDAYAAKGLDKAAAACYLIAREVSRQRRDLLREKEALEKSAGCAKRIVGLDSSYFNLSLRDVISESELEWKNLEELYWELKGRSLRWFQIWGRAKERADAVHKINLILTEAKLDPATYYNLALRIARRIRNTEEEYTLLLALGELHQQSDSDKAISSYTDALNKARDLGDSEKILPCLIGLIKVHGFTNATEVERYKGQARDILTKMGKLRATKIHAFLLDEWDRIPAIINSDKPYRLLISLGDIPESLFPTSELLPSGVIPEVEIIYNLSAPTAPLRRGEFLGECLDIRPMSRTPSEAVVEESEDTAEAIREPILKPEAGLPQPEFLRPGAKRVLSEGETGFPKESIETRLGITTPLDFTISLTGIGFFCKDAKITKSTLSEASGVLLYSLVIPSGTGNVSLDVKIEINGIPYRLVVSSVIEKSRVEESKEFSIAISQIKEITKQLNALYTSKYPVVAPNFTVFNNIAQELNNLVKDLPREVYIRIILQLLFDVSDSGQNGQLYAAGYLLRLRPLTLSLPILFEIMLDRKYRGTAVWQVLDAIHRATKDSRLPHLLGIYDTDWKVSLKNLLIRQASEHANHPNYTGPPFATTVVWGKVRQLSETFHFDSQEIFGFDPETFKESDRLPIPDKSEKLDIFVVYSPEDRERVRPLAEALMQEGLSIFWDRIIPVGTIWHKFLEEKLEAARLLLVVWSKNSIKNDWVRKEAQEGLYRELPLFPVLLDAVRPPFGFRSIQAADFWNWDGSQSSPVFQNLLRDIKITLGPPPTPETSVLTTTKVEISEPAAPESEKFVDTISFPSAEWHSRFGGREWRYDDNGVYIREHANGNKPLRTRGQPTTCQTIMELCRREIMAASQKYNVPLALIIMTIATETASYRNQGFTGPRTFRWEPHVRVTDIEPPGRGDYCAGPMQTLATIARWVIRTQNLDYDPFAVAPHYERAPTPPEEHPLYEYNISIDIGTALIKQHWDKTGDDPILVAAAYNVGGIYEILQNPWKIRSTEGHLDQAAKWYGDALAVLKEMAA